jgi:hypothetical protein
MGSPVGGAFTPVNPLAGTSYTPKVRRQIGQGDFHGFSASVDGFAGFGQVTSFRGGDGLSRTRVTLPGSFRDSRGNWRNGHFEWIIEPNRQVNHRFFVRH